MGDLFNEIIQEIKSVIGGKTIGAIVPPLVYVLANNWFGLFWGVVSAVLTAMLFGIARFIKGESIKYALSGLLGVLVAAGFAYYAGNAADYFVPRILSSGLMFLAALVTLIIGRPMAALASHISRGWEMAWFLRRDIKPAYAEVTAIWALLFLARMFLQYVLYQGGNLALMAWANLLLGFPATLTVLVLSYLYGIWRLRKLGGPGIDEYQEQRDPPWRGQTRGF